jgi:hypothetical protein
MNHFGRVAAYLSSAYWCVYSAQCKVRLLLVCVQCTMQNETVIGVCTVHTAAIHTNKHWINMQPHDRTDS